MDAKTCLQKLSNVRALTFAAVEAAGNPRVCSISAIHYEPDAMYFFTARGKEFCRERLADGRVQLPAGFMHGGERFQRYSADFEAAYGFYDMDSDGFYPFATPEERWACWIRNICANRYPDPPKPVYEMLRQLIEGKDHFEIIPRVDHCFQKTGFDKRRLFCTQGDHGLP